MTRIGDLIGEHARQRLLEHLAELPEPDQADPPKDGQPRPVPPVVFRAPAERNTP